MKEDIEVKKVFAGIAKNLKNKKWDCMLPGCSNMAINSHLLQRNGVLSHIIENGHCYEQHPKDVFKMSIDTFPFEFKLRGIQEAISIDLFCNKHDTELFKPIETDVVDYDDYSNQLLLSYRTVCAEIRRKEVEIERNNRLANSKTLQTIRPDITSVAPEISKASKQGIDDLCFYKELLEIEIHNPSNNFFFVHYSYPIRGLYASSAFTIASEEETKDYSKVLDTCFGHIVPTESKTEVIFGYHKEHVNSSILNFISGWSAELNKEQIGKQLTGLFTLIEGWGMSPSLYDKIDQDDINHFLGLLMESAGTVSQTPNVDFNLFSGLL